MCRQLLRCPSCVLTGIIITTLISCNVMAEHYSIRSKNATLSALPSVVHFGGFTVDQPQRCILVGASNV